MKILLSGGAGFIGSHLTERLLKDGHSVTCVDSLITGEKKNVAHLLKNRNFKFIKGDVSGRVNISGRFEWVLHFASPASPVDYMNFPIETLLAGSYGTKNMLDLARKNKARFFLASTSEVYGDPKVNPQPETYCGNVNPVGPRSVYDEAKRYAEAVTAAYGRKFGLKVKIARIFNTYGERMRSDDGRAIPNFICQALCGKDVTVYGDGSQTRSFCYVSDLVDGIIALMGSGPVWPVNLGNPDEMTVLDLAKTIRKLTGSKSGIIFKDLPENDPKQRRPDISLAKKELGWEPVVGLEQGLVKTIKWFREWK